MQTKLVVFGFLLILLVVNLQIYRLETRRDTGTVVFLKLAPRDPRSLLQGDYMRLRYEIASGIAGDGGVVYLQPDEQKLAESVRTEDGPGRVKLQYQRVDNRVTFGIDSFLFQEGRAADFNRARYAQIRVDDEGRPSLLRLLDEDLREI